MIYKIFHMYSTEGELYLDSNLESEEIADIIVSSQFMFEELVTNSEHIEETQLIPILEKFYSNTIKVVKDTDYKEVNVKNEIELFSAREKRCHPKLYHSLMADPILKTKDYKKMIKEIKYG